VKAYLPNSAHLANVGGFLGGVDPSMPDRFQLTIHNSWVSVHPFTIALTACMAAACRHAGGTIEVPSIPSHRSIAYLVRMKLFEVLGVDPGLTITEHESSGRFVPLTQIRTPIELKAALADLVPLLHAPAHVADPIRYVFSEMGRNVLEHARSPVGAFVCAQYYARSNRIAIGIADAGVGIRSTISRSHAAPTDMAAIRLALQPGVTGTTSRLGGTEFNAGAGLFFTKSIASLSKNLFVIVSGKSAFKLLRKRANDPPLLSADPAFDRHRFLEIPGWSGTAVGIDISVEQGSEFADLLDAIRKAYSIDVRARKKSYRKSIRFIS
jgi:anti-sigma regulatory factor (Ser/Thr protein kinase)